MFGTSKSKKNIWYILPLIVLIMVNAVVIAGGYDSYKDETIRMGRILTEEQMDEFTLEEAEKTLEKYGYIKEGQSSIYRRFMKLSVSLVILSIGLYVVIVISLKRQGKESGKKYIEIFDAVERNLDALKEGKYNTCESALKGLKDYDTNHIISRMDALTDSLYSSISVIKEKAEADKRETKDVVTDISHQLKTPLTAIKSTFEIMQNANLSADERKEVESLMGFQIASLEKLILSLVNISRLESGMIDIKLTDGNLFDSILEAVNSIWLKADEKNICIEFENCSEQKTPNVMRDRKWLVEAFINILDNAVKYSKENTEISIRVMNLNSMVRIEFQDQGIGIPAEEKHNVFKRFYRGSSSMVSEKSGSGVGLYLARRIISEHNGTIMVKDHIMDGKKAGSIFIVHLPLNQ